MKPQLVPTGSDNRAPHRATAAIVEMSGHDGVKAVYAAFAEFNARFFGGLLASPLVLVTLVNSRAYGDYIARDVHGLESRIRVSPGVFRKGAAFVLDVLLHEMIHAWAQEVAGDLERGYRGHGPKFAAKCNEIGAALGLPPVGVKGRDGKPDCAYWPLNVRPEGYYPTRWTKPKRGKGKDEPTGEGEGQDDEGAAPSPALLEKFRALLGTLNRATLEGFAAAVAEELERRN